MNNYTIPPTFLKCYDISSIRLRQICASVSVTIPLTRLLLRRNVKQRARCDEVHRALCFTLRRRSRPLLYNNHCCYHTLTYNTPGENKKTRPTAPSTLH